MLFKFLSLIGSPGVAHAQLSDVANFVGSGLLNAFGGGPNGAFSYVGIAEFLVGRAWLLVPIFGLLVLVRSGIKLIYGQSEDKFEEAKRAIANGLMAMVLTYLTLRIADAFIRVGGSESTGAAAAGSAILTTEIMGIVRWVSTLVAVLAIGMIVASVFTGILSMGSDDGIKKMRRSIFGAAAGIIIIILDVAFRMTFGLFYDTVPGAPSPFPLIDSALAIIAAILLFMALIAVCVVIYAGVRMVLSLGDEEVFKNMKSLILRALLGLFVILVSFIIVLLVVEAFSG